MVRKKMVRKRMICVLLCLLFVLGGTGGDKIFAEALTGSGKGAEIGLHPGTEEGQDGTEAKSGVEAEAKQDGTGAGKNQTNGSAAAPADGNEMEKNQTGTGSGADKDGNGSAAVPSGETEKDGGGTESGIQTELESLAGLERTESEAEPSTEDGLKRNESLAGSERTESEVEPSTEDGLKRNESGAESAAGSEETKNGLEGGQAGEKGAEESEVLGSAQEGEVAEASYLDGQIGMARPMQVLIVGNSFSRRKSGEKVYSVEKPLEELAAGEGKSLEVTTLAHGAARLRYYAGMNRKHLSYYRQLLTLLLNHEWDYIIFQEGSTVPLANFESSTYPAMQRLLQLVAIYQPQATPLLYMTPGYNNGKRVKVGKTPRRLTTPEFQMYLAAAYKTLENKLGVEAVPAGMHVLRANMLYPRIRTAGPDLKHPSYAGYYLAACSFYQKIYGSVPDPGKASLTGCSLTEKELRLLAGLAGDSMQVSRKEISLTVGKTARLSAVYSSHVSRALSVSYKSLDTKVASVNAATGLITAKGGGNTVIMATTSDGLQAFCNLSVACNAPAGLEAVPAGESEGNAQSGKIRVSWKAVSGAEGYDVYRSDHKGMTYRRIGSSSKNSYTDTEAAVNKVYYYKVVAKNTYAGDTSPLSGSARCIILKAPKLKAGCDGRQYVRLKWKRNAKATGYVIYRSARKNAGYQKIAELAKGKEAYIDHAVQKGKTYYYKIKAYKEWGGKVLYGIRSRRVKIKVV